MFSLHGATDSPVLATSGDISGFQTQNGQPYSHLAKMPTCYIVTQK